MKILYDPAVGALNIRLVEEQVECEVIRLNDQLAVDTDSKATSTSESSV